MQMNRRRDHVIAFALFACGMVVSLPAWAASLTQVARSEWTAGVNLPSYLTMYIYVPDKLATKPPIMVSSHSCGSSASGQMGNIPKSKAAADANGFILILPDNPNQNCWDVGSTQSLKHDGGGDTQAVALMVKYALAKYKGDAGRVYAMGGSSGGMMTQALMAVYPDIFRAGSARAGVPAGCWADGYSSSNQWSNNCAGGNTIKTAQQWGDLVRAAYPGYVGHRPRIQTMQGEADTTISYKNTGESIKEWTNVLGLSTAPTSTDTGYKAANATYDRQFWKNACGYTVFEAWSSPGGTHSMPYEEADILKFFGLNTAGGADPEADCSGGGGAGGAGGSGGNVGGTGGAGAARDGGADRGADSATSDAGGTQTSGGRSGGAGAGATGGDAVGTGGHPGGTGTGGTTGTSGSGGESGVMGSGGSSVTGSGGTTGSGGSSGMTGGMPGSVGTGATPGGASATGGSTSTAGNPSAGGCACAVAMSGEHAALQPLSTALLVALWTVRRRRRRVPDRGEEVP